MYNDFRKKVQNMRTADGFQPYDLIRTADRALEHLYNADSLLSSARNWGLADIFGGAIFITLAKRKKMDQAQEEMNAARKYINQLLRDLDVSSRNQYFNFEFEGPSLFFDYIGDVISDLYVQNKIEKARNQVLETIDKVEAIRKRLYELT